jgi:hypothetical protein
MSQQRGHILPRVFTGKGNLFLTDGSCGGGNL